MSLLEFRPTGVGRRCRSTPWVLEEAMKDAGLPHARRISLCAPLILFALSADPSAYAATAFVKSATNRAWATSASATFSGNVTAGNVIAVFVGSYPKAPTLTSVTATCVTGPFVLADSGT